MGEGEEVESALRDALRGWPRFGASWAALGLTARARALTSFFASAALVGLGFALVDQTQSGSNPYYYYGFGIAFLGILSLFTTSERALFRPLWFFGAAFLLEIYGWWNVFWTGIDLGKCAGCNLGSEIALANLGALWPFNGGVIDVPLAAFLATTVLALLVPIIVADRIRRDVVTRPDA